MATRSPVEMQGSQGSSSQQPLLLGADEALRFIEGYKRVLLEVHRRTSRKKPSRNIVETLAAAREKLGEAPALLDQAAAALADAGSALDPELLQALRSMRFDRWIYLRSTTRHAIFLDSAAENAYAVLGLTQTIDELLGGAAIAFETVLLPFAGRYVCDGIVQGPVLLGPGYRRDFNAALAQIRKAGRFHRAPER